MSKPALSPLFPFSLNCVADPKLQDLHYFYQLLFGRGARKKSCAELCPIKSDLFIIRFVKI